MVRRTSANDSRLWLNQVMSQSGSSGSRDQTVSSNLCAKTDDHLIAIFCRCRDATHWFEKGGPRGLAWVSVTREVRASERLVISTTTYSGTRGIPGVCPHLSIFWVTVGCVRVDLSPITNELAHFAIGLFGGSLRSQIAVDRCLVEK
jgi:hypothetical protein